MNRPHRGAAMMMAACLAAAAASGCGQRAETGTVSGRVTYQGQPVPQGSKVVFMNRQSGQVAFGGTAADGTFQLSMEGDPGVLTGEYGVGVVPPLTPDAWKLSPKEYSELYKSMAAAAMPAREWKEIPPKYYAAETSGETFTVQKGANEYTLDMRAQSAP